jgi:hypothetical protein
MHPKPVGYVLYSLHVCVGASDSKTASDDPSSSALCVVCTGHFPRGVLGGERYAPLGYAQRPVFFFFLGGFCYF